MKRSMIVCAALTLFLAGQAFAAGQGYGSPSSPNPMGKSSPGMSGSQSMGMSENQFGTNRVSQLMDKDVKGSNGEKIGEVSDVILDRNGSVSYIVISHGGVLGMGDRLTPIPISAFHKGNGNDLTVNMDKNRLANAPNFTSNNWPNFEDRNWDQQVRGYYGSSGASGSGSMGGSGSSTRPPGSTGSQQQ